MIDEKKTMRIEMTRGDDFIRFGCHGMVSQAALVELLDMVKTETAKGPSKVLVDLKSMEGNLDVMDRYSLGVAVATHLLGKRIAVVVEKHKITKVGENTAVNRGANMFVTHDEGEALAWLLKY